ncbi:DUF4116 domain-containing protein [Variovorax sp. RB3P1]|uniref:DUF4116 domain-containing protein n=1 Tax=Variovorax sp. RB3P1 TaxID=3443732 RepID=UPI003F455D24
MTPEYQIEKEKSIAHVVADKCTGRRFAIEDLSSAMRGDRDVVIAAERHRHNSITYATKKLRNDKEFMMQATEINGANFRYASPKLRDDRELAMHAVKRFGFALTDCSDSLKDDIHIVREAIINAPSSYNHASKRIQDMFGSDVMEIMRNENKLKILDSEILHEKLNKACAPKVESHKPKMKI